jgi:hypothetical protein
MPRHGRDPFHPSLFAPTEVPAGVVYRPRIRPVQPTASVITSPESDLSRLLNDLIRRSHLIQLATSRLDEGGWSLIATEMGRFFARGGVATLTVGRLFELPRAGTLELLAWRAATRTALERGLQFWARVTDGARVLFWPRFLGNMALFDAGSALHALSGSAPLTERALGRTSGQGRCDATLHLTASDPEWAGGDVELEEKAICAAAIHPIYGFFNGETRATPASILELTPARVAQALRAISAIMEWIAEVAGPGLDPAGLEAQLLRRLAEEAEEAPTADVTFPSASPERGALALDAAARPLLEACIESGAAMLFRMPQPRFDFRATVEIDPEAKNRLRLAGLPPSRLVTLLRRGRIRLREPFTLVQHGPHTVRVVPLPPPATPRA